MSTPSVPPALVLVAAHKPYWMPPDPLYVPMCVGAEHNGPIPGFLSDNTGDNISHKNARYCELTALWWGWRNLKADALGLVHYRRHFAGSGERRTLRLDEALSLLGQAPVVVPKARNYVIESVGSHYAHTHDPAHLEALRAGVAAVSPAAVQTLDARLESTSAHMFNMLIARKEVLDPYCEWLFDVLAATEKRIEFGGLSAFDERCVGRLGELLLDVWLDSHDVPVAEVPLRELEHTSLLKRGRRFLAAKYLGRTYDGSL